MQSWEGKNLAVKILYSRAGVAQHILITNDKGAVLVDTGDGIIRDTEVCGFDLCTLTGIVFTHGHFDHVGGLYSLLGFLRMVGRKESLQIVLPKGCIEIIAIIDSFMKTYSDTMPFNIYFKNIKPYEKLQVADMIIEAYPVVHCGSIAGRGILEQIPAMGYRIFYKGEIIAISGDTGTSAPLKELVEEADLAILEAVLEKSEGVDKELLHKVHLSEDVAKDLGKLAKDFILIHKGRRG